MGEATHVLQIKVKAGGVTHFDNGGWHEGKCRCVLDLGKSCARTLCQAEHVGDVAFPLFPRLKPYKRNARVLATAGQAKALYGHERHDPARFFLPHVIQSEESACGEEGGRKCRIR